MESENDIHSKVVDILNISQQSSAKHPLCIEKLSELCRLQGGQKVLLEHFIPLIRHVLVVYKREQSVERAISFIVDFAVSSDQVIHGEKFYSILIRFLLPFTRCVGKLKSEIIARSLRFRSTQIIASVLNSLSDESELSDELWLSIQKHLVERLQDKVSLIRVQSSIGLTRLQDSRNKNDPVTRIYLHLLNSDSSKEVRKAALLNVVINRLNLEQIITRCRDVSPEVRKCTFELLRDRISIKQISHSHCITLLENGLYDLDASVRDACIDLCLTWLRQLDFDLPRFLSFFDVEHNEKLVDKLLCKLFPSIPVPESCINWKSSPLTHEFAILWRNYCQYLKTKRELELLERILPDSLDFIDLIESTEGSSFFLRQILMIGGLIDHVDEYERETVQSRLKDLLIFPEVEESLVELITTTLKIFSKNQHDFIDSLHKLILSIREQANESELPTSSIDTLIELDSDTKAIRDQLAALNGIKALDLNPTALSLAESKEEQLEAELEDVVVKVSKRENIRIWSIIRSLGIYREILSHATVEVMQKSEFASLLTRYVLPAMECDSVHARSLALKCIGMYMRYLPEKNEPYYRLCLHAAEHDEGPIQEVAIKILFDLLIIFGVEGQQENVLRYLRNHLKAASPHTTLAVEGFVKLFIGKRLRDTDILMDLLILLFDPKHLLDLKLQRILSLFFPAFSFVSYSNQRLILDTFVPLCRKIFGSPPNSSLSKICIPTFLQLYAYLTNADQRISVCKKQGRQSSVPEDVPHLHNCLAVLTLLEICASPASKEVQSLCKIFEYLVICPQKKWLAWIFSLTQRAISVISKSSQKNLRIFLMRIRHIDHACASVVVSDDKIDMLIIKAQEKLLSNDSMWEYLMNESPSFVSSSESILGQVNKLERVDLLSLDNECASSEPALLDHSLSDDKSASTSSEASICVQDKLAPLLEMQRSDLCTGVICQDPATLHQTKMRKKANVLKASSPHSLNTNLPFSHSSLAKDMYHSKDSKQTALFSNVLKENAQFKQSPLKGRSRRVEAN
ncbi:condensin complex subunit 3-like [Schistocerca gregaria]|uniref:condensin complex subunit 3-like n=1 Tax=Schistocerca gregaria TaxID=7010 RepID=UPI00211E3E1B|nr:condensin complex subunit 3-like [Schistocerca gregaria]